MSRISRDQMFMEIANVVAKRGTCDRAQVGAVLVVKGRIVSIGYNGSLPGEPHCDNVGHVMVGGHCVRTTHAEVNCIDFAYEYLLSHSHADGSIVDATLYVTHLPCKACMKYIAMTNARRYPYLRVKRIVFNHMYPPGAIMGWEVEGVDTIEQFEV